MEEWVTAALRLRYLALDDDSDTVTELPVLPALRSVALAHSRTDGGAVFLTLRQHSDDPL